MLKVSNWLRAEEGEAHGKGEGEEREVGIREAYAQLWSVVRLPAVRKLALVLLAFRLGMLPAELAAPLKLLEKGVSKEALAGLVRRPADFLHPSSVCFCALKICM